MKRRQGRLIRWEDDRGFGFIEADDTSGHLFVHIKQIRAIATRPLPGDRVTFSTGQGRDGRPSAIDVVIDGANPLDRSVLRRGEPVAPRQAMPQRLALRLVAAAVLITIVVAAIVMRRLPNWTAIVYLGAGVASICAYWIDKDAAESGGWRTREKTLHTIDLFGGIAGGLVAQALLRHKTSKPGFAAITTAILLIHVCALAALAILD
jgi:uncharacterized membrane protein YsdA (DUF1294 family)/cold shock CspA family protein